MKWFKVQTAFGDGKVLVYNFDRSVRFELEGELAKQLADHLGMKSKGDKLYVKGSIVKKNFVVDPKTISKEERGW